MKTVKCSQCKHEINAEDVICMYCGSPNLVKEQKEEEIEQDFQNIKNERHANEEIEEEKEATEEVKEEEEPEINETETLAEPAIEEKPKRTRKTTTKKTTTAKKPRKTTKKKEEKTDIEENNELKVEIPLEEILDRQSKHIEEELNKEHHDFDEDEDVILQDDISLDEIMNDKSEAEEVEDEKETTEELEIEDNEETSKETKSDSEDVVKEKPEEESIKEESSNEEEKEEVVSETNEGNADVESEKDEELPEENANEEEEPKETEAEEEKEVELKKEIPLEDIIGESVEKKETPNEEKPKEEVKEEIKEEKPEIKEYKPDRIEDTSVIKLNNTMDIASIFDEASDLLMSYGNADEVVRLIETKYDLDHAKALSYVEVATKMAKNKAEKEELVESGIIEKEEEPEVKEEPKEDVNPDSITSIMSKLENYHNYTKAAMKKSKDPEEVAKLIMNEFSELDHDSAIELISQVKKDFIYKMAIIIGAALSLLIIIILAIF